jgi:dephospho-CoA kinase
MLIGIVGKSGAGKSFLVNKMICFDNDIIHIDIDKIGHSILKRKDVIENIIDIIGNKEIIVNGVVDRKKIGSIIFNDLKKYDAYYRYTEKVEYEVIDEIITSSKGKNVILDWINLDKSKYWKILDCKVLVKSDYGVRKKRVIARDNISEKYFDLRDNVRKEYNEKEMDYVVDGNNISDNIVKEILGGLR